MPLQTWLFAIFNQAYRVHPVVPLQHSPQNLQPLPHGFSGANQLLQSEAQQAKQLGGQRNPRARRTPDLPWYL